MSQRIINTININQLIFDDDTGEVGQHVAISSGMPSWIYGLSSYGKYSNTTGQNLAPSSESTITFPTTIISHPAFTYSSNGNFTANFSGNFKFTYQTNLTNGVLLTTTSSSIKILKNNVTVSIQQTDASSGTSVLFSLVDIIPCNQNDVIKFTCVRASGAGNMISSTTSTWLLIE